jgi:hypothetical protein
MGGLHKGDPGRLQHARRGGEITSGDEQLMAALA